MGDRICIMSGGRVVQTGRPMDVYRHPADVFVAGFLGSPPMNLLPATVRGGVVTAGTVSMPLPGARDGDVVLGVRPERLTTPAAGGAHPELEMVVDIVEPLGSEVIVHGSLPGVSGPITARLDATARPAPGGPLRLAFDPGAAHVFDAASGDAITQG